jgi:hypothetical protein
MAPAQKTFLVEAPNGKKYRVKAPAGSTQAQVEAAVIKAYPEARGSSRKPREGAVGKVETFGMGLTRGIDEAIFGTGRLIGQGLEYVGATDLGGRLRRASQGELDKSLSTYQPFVRTNPTTAEVGRVGGQIIGLVAPAGAVAKPLQLAGKVIPKIAPVTTALASSGFATGVKTATPLARAMDAALRVTGGATAGVTTSAVLGQQIDEGGAVGAAVAMIPLVGRYGAGPVWDMLKGRIGEARAAKVFRQALGSNVEAAREAFRKGGKGTPAQILARIGIDADTFFATGELVAKSGSGTGVLDDIARGQEAARQATLDAAAGGVSREASRRAAGTQRAVTTEQAVPIMKETLEGVNVNTRNAMATQKEAVAARQLASAETDDARRLLAANDRSAALIRESGLRLPADIKRQREIVAGLERFGGEAAERGLEAGAVARSAEQRLADLSAAGVKPLDPNVLSGRLRQMATAERANPEKAGILNGFADQIDDLATQNNGILDAFDLYELRKDAGGIVERLLSGRAPDAIRKRTAEVIGAFRPLVDDAIKTAGGARWKEYFDTFSTGMDEARRIELSDFARKLATDQPEQYQRLMKGDRPDIVERFFGKGNDEIANALGPKALEMPGPVRLGQPRPTAVPAGPSRIPALQDVAGDLETASFIKNRMTSGAQARAADIMEPPVNVMAEFGRSVPFGLGSFVERPAILAEQKFFGPRSVRALERGFATPEGANALLNFLPAGQRSINALENISPDVLRVLQLIGVQAGREPERNNKMRR